MIAGPELFYESWEEAMKEDIKAMGGTKVVGKLLWPDLDVDIARNRLNDRLNPERRERLSDSQERMIMRGAREAKGFSAAMYFLADETGFERPKSREPEDEIAELQREFITAVKKSQLIAERFERLTQPAIKVAK